MKLSLKEVLVSEDWPVLKPTKASQVFSKLKDKIGINDPTETMEALKDIDTVMRYLEKVREEITHGEIDKSPTYLRTSAVLLGHIIKSFG